MQDSDSTTPENGIPVLRLTIDPTEYQNMISSPKHEYRATGATIGLDVPTRFTGEFSTAEPPSLENCGNYLMHNLGMTKWYAKRYADYLAENEDNPQIFAYPKSERLVTEDDRQFFDS